MKIKINSIVETKSIVQAQGKDGRPPYNIHEWRINATSDKGTKDITLKAFGDSKAKFVLVGSEIEVEQGEDFKTKMIYYKVTQQSQYQGRSYKKDQEPERVNWEAFEKLPKACWLLTKTLDGIMPENIPVIFEKILSCASFLVDVAIMDEVKKDEPKKEDPKERTDFPEDADIPF